MKVYRDPLLKIYIYVYTIYILYIIILVMTVAGPGGPPNKILVVSNKKPDVFHPRSAMNPNGLRVGTPAMTSRGLMEEDFVKIGQSLGQFF